MRPSVNEQHDYLMQICFGTKSGELGSFISRAYRDMNRTFHGIGKLSAGKDKYGSGSTDVLVGANETILKCFIRLRNKNPPGNPTALLKEFDNWHSTSCRAMVQYYAKKLHHLNVSNIRLTYGQAQKWLNMALKYCWVCGSRELDWLNPWFAVAHVPVDDVILRAAQEEAFIERPCKRWSKWNSEKEYLAFQMDLRKAARAQNESPLQMELRWWPKYRND